MRELTLREIQELMRKYYFRKDSSRGIHATFTWFVEEVGELAEAILSGSKERVEEEAADVMAWLASLSNLAGIDLEKAFRKKYLNPEPPC